MTDTPILIREAREEDIPAISEIFHAVYKSDYPYRQFLDIDWLKRSLFNDYIIMLVAVEPESGKVLGTGSVVLETGAHSDLLGEFGRLVVDPNLRQSGVGKAIMQKRVECVQDRLHVGIVENRTSHPFSQKISRRFDFVPAGFLPMKFSFHQRESMALFVRHFGNALELRNNHPRIIPEIHSLASRVLENCGLKVDTIIDEETPSYTPHTQFEVEELTTDCLSSLLHIKRGRILNREIFGPLRLHYGFFRLQAKHGSYLVAREPSSEDRPGTVVGAIGYIHDETEKGLKIFELIHTCDEVVRFLLEKLLHLADLLKVEYLEVDVSAHAPRMQRTLLEMGFLPVAYIPAMVFSAVERIDVVKMARLNVPLELKDLKLIPEMQPIADIIIKPFTRKDVVPEVARTIGTMTLFEGLTQEQTECLACLYSLAEFQEGEFLFQCGNEAEHMHILLEGSVAIALDDAGRVVGQVTSGEPLGEVAFLTGGTHSASARAESLVRTAQVDRKDLKKLIRQRPDIGLLLYKNLALSLGRKLREADLKLLQT